MTSSTPGAALLVGFDLDLTLVDSRERIGTCLAAALADEGVVLGADEAASTIGLPLSDGLDVLAPGLSEPARERVVADYRRRHDAPGAPPMRAMAHAREALTAVRAAGGRTAVISAKLEPVLRRALAETGLDPLVDVVVGGRFGAGKGEVLREIGASGYVGDHPGDVLAALSAGVEGLAVLTGGTSETELRAAGAREVVDDLGGFEAWLAGHVARLAAHGTA